MSRWPVALATALCILTAAWPVRAEAAARAVRHGDPSCRRIALTFDVEIVPARTRAILDVLARYGARSTFFFLGQSIRVYPDIARAIAAIHEVGNHTESHPYLTRLDRDGIAAEIQAGADSIAAVTGASPAPLFRPPYGDYNAPVLQAAGRLGYPYLVMWSVDTRDWEGLSADAIAARITGGAEPGGIVLMHGTAPHTAAGLDQAMAALWQQGYQFTTVGDLLGLLPDRRDLGGSRYVVQNGDTPGGIAACWRVRRAALLAANNVAPGTGVAAGRVLTIPYADQITVRVPAGPLDTGAPLRTAGNLAVLPLGPLARALGARVAWDHSTDRVAVQLGWRTLHLHAGSTAALAAGRPLILPRAPALQDADLMVPLRAVCQALDVAVAWDADARTIDLTPPAGASGPAVAGRGRGRLQA